MRWHIGLLAIWMTSPLFVQAQEAGDWPQLRGGSGYTGVSPDDSVKPPLRLVWSYRCDADTSGDAGSGVTVAGGKVFANMEMSRSIIALDAKTGRFLWEYQHPDVNYTQTSAYAGGRLYVWLRKYGRSALVALDAETGKETWSVKLKESKHAVARRCGPLIVEDQVIISDQDQEPVILALDLKSGQERWRRPLGQADGELVATPCAAGGLIFTGTHNTFTRGVEVRGRVVALDARSGAVVWSNRDLYPSRHMVTDGKVLVCKINREVAMKPADNQKLYVLDAKTGKEIWSVPIKSLYGTETITKDLIIEKHYGSQMVARARDTGKEIWSSNLRTGSGCSSPSISGKFAYVGTGSFNDSEGLWAWRFLEPPHRQKGVEGCSWTLHAIDLETGKSVWNFLTGCNVCGDPAIAYGRLYVNSRDGRIYCFAPVQDGAPALADSPDRTPSVPAEQVRALLAQPLPAPAAGQDWPMAGGTPARTGIEMQVELPLTPAWSLDTGGPVTAAAAIRAGRVYVGAHSGKILAADLKDGHVLWEFKAGGAVRAAPAVAGGLVYCGADDGVFYALDAVSGKVRWRYATGGPVQAAPAVVGGVVFFAAHDHHLYALDRHTGKKLWSFRTEQPLVQAAPVVHGDQVFAAQWVDWAFALDAATGKEQWRSCVPISIEALHFHRDRLWLRSPRQFAEFDPKTGKRLRIGHAPYGYNGLAFAGSQMFTAGVGAVRAVNLDLPGEPTNEQKRTPNLEDVMVLQAKSLPGQRETMGTPLVLGDRLCLATKKGELLVMSLDGKVLWSASLGSTCHATPVAADGFLVVGCDDGKLYAFKAKNR